ncbi:MAG: 6,7-dimethyl-8-ribityllumazine synthase [Muribaculaceae bacterium]|jgi:6,7-dimethyl-8-ribityllumazine synthase|nr:6,7-dimethyl-8-ribityllumazine synthase [Muribaculaceae bacterium]
MSTVLNKTEGASALHSLPHVDGLTVGIVCAEWNDQITGALLQGALDLFTREGYEDITVAHVPGTVELTYGAAQMARTGRYDAVIMIGCVIRGGTPHFDYVCDNVTQGCAYLNATQNVPIIFCVLTTDDLQQALDRAGGALCNKGTEAAEAAIKMANFTRKLQN